MIQGTFEVVRFYREDIAPEVLETGLTLRQARERIADPETSSATCTSAEGEERTVQFGDWFEGFRRE